MKSSKFSIKCFLLNQLLVSLITIILAMNITSSYGQIAVWSGNDSQDWGDPDNWEDNLIPTSSDSVYIPNTSNQPIINNFFNIRALEVETSATLHINLEFALNINGSNTIRRGVNLKGSIVNNGSLVVRNMISHGIQIETGGSLENNGLTNLQVEGLIGIENKGTLVNNDRLNISRTQNVDVVNNSGVFTNNGYVDISSPLPGGTRFAFIITNSLTNNQCATIHIRSIHVFDDFTSISSVNDGTIIENSSGACKIGTNNGIIYNLGGGTFSVFSGNAPLTSIPATNVWTGSSDNDWFNICNWSSGIVPDFGHEVQIPMTSTNPEINNNEGQAKSLFIYSSAALTVNSGLAVFGSNDVGLKNEGTCTFNGPVRVENSTQGGIENLGTITNNNQLFISGFGSTGIYNLNGFANASSATIEISKDDSGSGIGFWNSGSSPTLNNEGLMTFLNLDQGLNQDGTSSIIINHQCAAMYFTGRSVITINEGSITNQGLIDYRDAPFSFLTGTIDGTGGFIYDPNDLLDCPSWGAGECLDFSMTFEQFREDADGNGTTTCQGDLSCLYGSVVVNGNDNGDGSLRNTIGCVTAGSTITFADPFTIDLTGGQINIDKDVEIIGLGSDQTVISGMNDDASRLLEIANGQTVLLKNLTLSEGGGVNFSDIGAAIYTGTDAVLELINAKVVNNMSNGNATVMFFGHSSFKIINTHFASNIAADGSVLWAQENVKGSLSNCLISSNTSIYSIVSLGDAQMDIHNSTFANNINSTGVIGSFNQTELKVYNSILYNNTGVDINNQTTNVFEAKNNILENYNGANNPIGSNNNTSDDPLFEGFGFRPSANSLAINTGDLTLIPMDTCDIDGDGITLSERLPLDIDGSTRLFRGQVDKGAYEVSHNLCRYALPIRCGLTVIDSTTETVQQEFGANSCQNNRDNYRGLWYQYIGTGDSIVVSTCGGSTNYDTRLIIENSCSNELVCNLQNDDFCNLQSQVSFLSVSGEIYRIYVAGFTSSNTGIFELSVECVCGDRALTFDNTNNFSDGDNYTARTNTTITATNTIEKGADVRYDANQCTELGKQFEVEDQAMFVVTTEGCLTPRQGPVEPSAPDQKTMDLISEKIGSSHK